jgi:hypothetical protein
MQLILYWNVFMPTLIKDKLDVTLDSANQSPFVFTAFIPTGPAMRFVTYHLNTTHKASFYLTLWVPDPNLVF